MIFNTNLNLASLLLVIKKYNWRASIFSTIFPLAYAAWPAVEMVPGSNYPSSASLYKSCLVSS